MKKRKITEEEFNKLHDKTIKIVLEYSDHLIEEGIKSTSFTLTNDFVVTFRDLKRKARITKEKKTNE